MERENKNSTRLRVLVAVREYERVVRQTRTAKIHEHFL